MHDPHARALFLFFFFFLFFSIIPRPGHSLSDKVDDVIFVTVWPDHRGDVELIFQRKSLGPCHRSQAQLANEIKVKIEKWKAQATDTITGMDGTR